MKSGFLMEYVMSEFSYPNAHEEIFSGIDYHSHTGCDVSLVCYGPPTKAVVANIKKANYVKSVDIINNYLNIDFNNNFNKIYLKTKAKMQQIKKNVHIEHTGLPVVFPLSVAAIRNSIHSEWLRRTLVYLGYDVKSRIWVQDSARHVSLVNSIVVQDNNPLENSVGKGDHSIGRIFAESLLVREGLSKKEAKDLSGKMFPLGKSAIRFSTKDSWIKHVLLGWKDTLKLAKIHVDYFDFDSKVLGTDWIKTLEEAKKLNKSPRSLQEEYTSSTKLTYFDRCILYYCFLLRNSDIAYSIIYYRQTDILTMAKELACDIEQRKHDDLILIPIGEVFIDNKLDRIKEGRFTIVDNLKQYANEDINCIIERFLIARSGSDLNLSFPIYPVKSYVNIHKIKASHVVSRAILVLDELLYILQNSLRTGDFTKTIHWTGHAIEIYKLLEDRSSDIAIEIQTAIELFSPFPLNKGE